MIWNRKKDIEAAVDYLRSHFNVRNEQIILMGHSLGAAQILIAANKIAYRLLIPIGLGDYDNVLNNMDSLRDYIIKFERNTGIMITEEIMKNEGAFFRPQNLFSPCPYTPVALIFGDREKDHINSFYYNAQKLPDECSGMIRWHTVPISNHMYFTESRSSLVNKSRKLFSIVYPSLSR